MKKEKVIGIIIGFVVGLGIIKIGKYLYSKTVAGSLIREDTKCEENTNVETESDLDFLDSENEVE